jgi:hypothetical protein
MQTLGLSDSTPRTESRLKSLFWPSINTSSDVDYLGAQGYWVCAAIAVFSFVFLTITGHPIAGALVLLFYYLSAVGVRERSRFAAGCVLLMYVGDTIAAPGIVKVLLTALLLSNFRATWIASRWKPESDEAVLPPRWSDTWSDKFADQLPMWLWPKVRIFYYVLSAGYLLVFAIGLAVIIRRHT